MTDKEKAPPKPVIPNTVTPAQGVKDLLSDIPKEFGGSNPDKNAGSRPIRGKIDENGVRVITYTLNGSRSNNSFAHTSTYPLLPAGSHEELSDSIKRCHDQWETAANIRFEEVEDFDPKNPPDITYYYTPEKLKEAQGWADSSDNENGTRYVVVSLPHVNSFKPGADLDGIITHESGHALGLSHPGEGFEAGKNTGNDLRYNKNYTIMSYHAESTSTFGFGIGRGDIAAVQALYGRPKNLNVHQLTTANQLREKTNTLISEKPITLDFREGFTENENAPYMPTHISINLDVTNSCEPLVRLYSKNQRVDAVYLSFGTEARHVLASDACTTRMKVSGNKYRNRLQGGSKDDTFTFVGGEDIATGNSGADTFIIDTESGHHNLITDYEPLTEEFFVFTQNKANAIQYTYRQDYPAPLMSGMKGPLKGTLIQLMENGKPVSSVFAMHEKNRPPNIRVPASYTPIYDTTRIYDTYKNAPITLQLLSVESLEQVRTRKGLGKQNTSIKDPKMHAALDQLFAQVDRQVTLRVMDKSAFQNEENAHLLAEDIRAKGIHVTVAKMDNGEHHLTLRCSDFHRLAGYDGKTSPLSQEHGIESTLSSGKKVLLDCSAHKKEAEKLFTPAPAKQSETSGWSLLHPSPPPSSLFPLQQTNTMKCHR